MVRRWEVTFGRFRISRADVADFMLKQLTDDAYVGAAPGLGW